MIFTFNLEHSITKFEVPIIFNSILFSIFFFRGLSLVLIIQQDGLLHMVYIS